MKKRWRLPAAGMVFCILLAACAQPAAVDIAENGAPLSPAPEQEAAVPLYNYGELTEQYVSDPFHAGMLADSWGRPDEIDPEAFPIYFVFLQLRTDRNPLDGLPLDDEGYSLVPRDTLESAVRAHFDVPAEHLRKVSEGFTYVPEKEAYRIDGVGSVTDCEVIDAVRTGDLLELTYDAYRVERYSGRGLLRIRVAEDGGYHYLSHEILRESAAYRLVFPSAHRLDITVTDRIVTLDAGGWSGRGEQGTPEFREYDGRQLDSVVAFYRETAEELHATGEEDAGMYAGGWAWSGTYGDEKPLVIHVFKDPPDAESYTVKVEYDRGWAGVVETLTPRSATGVALHEEKAAMACTGTLEELIAYYSAATGGIGAVGEGQGIDGACWKWSGTYRGSPLSIFISVDGGAWKVDIRY